MLRTSILCCLSLITAADPVTAADRTASSLLPDTTVFYAEIANPSDLISTIFDHPLRENIESLEPYRMATNTVGYRAFLTGRKFVEIQLGMEWREAIETLTSRGIYLGVDAKTQGVALLINGKDAASMDLFRNKLLELSKLGKNPEQIKEGEYRGVTAYEVNKSKFAVVDDWLLITNKGDLGKVLLDRFLDGTETSLTENENFQAARKSRNRNASVWAYADIATVRDSGVAPQLYSGQSSNPGVELLVGGFLSTLQKTPFASAQLNASHQGIELGFSMPHKHDWVPEERNFYFGPDGTGHGPILPHTKNTLFTLSTYRDISEMWLRAGDLFNENINDGLAQADASLTTFFSGKDFGEDILGSLTPQVGFVAARQDFTDILPVPTIKLPQFALVMQLKDPGKMARELRRTFQSMIGFFNVVGAMEGRSQLEMDIDKLDNGAELITSVYIPDEDDAASTRADIIYNFSPSVGFFGERFVVASTHRLARELVQADVPADDSELGNTHVQLEGDILRQVLNDNRGQLVSQNMLEDGNSREEAENTIDLLLEVVGYFKHLSASINVSSNQLGIELGLHVKSD
ncbi:MAG: hypothetical protein GY758_17190 [Fuerstiella sp.]|nr:hypothetical protein [Fuerstiella sp.]MCP4508940.1 hypothetical protein [Fuerstiella sp.]